MLRVHSRTWCIRENSYQSFLVDSVSRNVFECAVVGARQELKNKQISAHRYTHIPYRKLHLITYLATFFPQNKQETTNNDSTHTKKAARGRVHAQSKRNSGQRWIFKKNGFFFSIPFILINDARAHNFHIFFVICRLFLCLSPFFSARLPNKNDVSFLLIIV